MGDKTDRFYEFFLGENDLMSMSRLLPFMAFFPASYVLIKTMNEAIFGWYVSTFAAMYLGGKGIDGFRKLPEMKEKEDVVSRSKRSKE